MGVEASDASESSEGWEGGLWGRQRPKQEMSFSVMFDRKELGYLRWHGPYSNNRFRKAVRSDPGRTSTPPGPRRTQTHTHTHTHTSTHKNTHARTHARARARTHAQTRAPRSNKEGGLCNRSGWLKKK